MSIIGDEHVYYLRFQNHLHKEIPKGLLLNGRFIVLNATPGYIRHTVQKPIEFHRCNSWTERLCWLFKEKGRKYEYRWYKNNLLHRENGPALTANNGHKEWFIEGNRFRANGPSIIDGAGTQYWQTGDDLHRKDEPAVIHADGSKKWYQHGQLHREDGPAVETSYMRRWALHGVEYTEEGYEKKRLNEKLQSALPLKLKQKRVKI